MENTNNKAKEFELSEGLEFDVEEGWAKIINRQFGGNPGRGFGELIQNLIDSYPESIPMSKRKGVIISSPNSISITDYGSGFSKQKLRLIITLGGTDKSDDKCKIGQFGIGFFSIFNESLQTKQVMVTTKCEGFVVQVRFTVLVQGKIPKIEMRVIEENIDFSTRVEVKFNKMNSSDSCLKYAKRSLEYYPCKIQINGIAFQSKWEEARRKNWYSFNTDACNGYIKPSYSKNKVKVLCKYEYIINLRMNNLLSGSEMPLFTLDDFDSQNFPYVPNKHTLVNNNDLSLTISRDSFYLNSEYQQLVDDLREEFFQILSSQKLKNNKQLALANLFILRYDIAHFVKTGEFIEKWSTSKRNAITKLANAKVFKLAGKGQRFNILDLKRKLSEGIPLFYSPNKQNIRWLGGQFKNDFVLLPERCHIEHGAKDFYSRLLNVIFSDTVDLDQIQGNNEMIQKLVERKIISKRELEPTVDFIGENRLSSSENELLVEINHVLQNKGVIEAIESNLYLNIRSIRAIFFEVRKEGALISTGVFDETMNPVNDDFISNLYKKKGEEGYSNHKSDLILGLRKDHPLVKHLIGSKNMNKAYFALTYIAHELAFCQKLLVPYSTFFNWTKEKMAAEMRRALMKTLIDDAA